jgi:hypothetical protein
MTGFVAIKTLWMGFCHNIPSALNIMQSTITQLSEELCYIITLFPTLLLNYPRSFLPVMEPEGLLGCSQNPPLDPNLCQINPMDITPS